MQTLGHVALVVRDYDEAIAFFTGALGFQLIEDTAMGDGKAMGGCGAFGFARDFFVAGSGGYSGASQPHRESDWRARVFVFADG